MRTTDGIIFKQGVCRELCGIALTKESDTMAGKSSCEFCAYYNYNEAFDDYECEVNLDEDDLGRFMSGTDSSCPYFRFSDDYKIVEKQN